MILTSLGNIALDLVLPPSSPPLSSLSCCQSGHLYTSVQNSSLTGERERVGEETYAKKRKEKGGGEEWVKERISQGERMTEK